MAYIGVISYNSLTNPLLASWDIQVKPKKSPLNENPDMGFWQCNQAWTLNKNQDPYKNPSVSCFRIKPNHLKNRVKHSHINVGRFRSETTARSPVDCPWSKKPKSFFRPASLFDVGSFKPRDASKLVDPVKTCHKIYKIHRFHSTFRNNSSRIHI